MAWGLGVLAAMALLCPANSASAQKTQISSQDHQATQAFLAAIYAYDSAKLAATPASKAALEGLANRLAGECPGVMKNAPQEAPTAFTELAETLPAPRQQGEQNRQERQREALTYEVSESVSLTLLESYRQAALVFVAQVNHLSWSDVGLTEFIHTSLVELEHELNAAIPNVCADMRTWVASGYKTLSPASKELLRERELLLTTLIHRLQHAGYELSGPSPLVRYEDKGAKAIVRKLQALQPRQIQAFKSESAATKSLRNALGIVEPKLPKREWPPKGSTVIGKGRTAADTRYTIRLLPKSYRPEAGERRCSPQIAVEVKESLETYLGVSIAIEMSDERCLSPRHPRPPTAKCDAQSVVIEAETGPRVRAVALRLSNGRRITSRIAFVSPRRGGPVGFYYQALKRNSAMPVALTEMDAKGKPLRIVKLHKPTDCGKMIRYLPGGVRTIVRDQAPGGPPFSIVGKRYRFQGKVHFKLDLQLEEGIGFEGGIDEVFGPEGRPGHPIPFEWQTEKGCHPNEYAIIYGVFDKPGDSILAKMRDGSLQPFHQVPIPASLHAKGVLAYIALSAMPTELIVRDAAGKTIFSEDLSEAAKALTERCEGEAEG